MAFGRGLLFVWIGIELISSVYLAIRLVSKVVIIYNPTPNTSESKRKRRPIIIKWDNRRKPWLPVCVWPEYFIGGAVFFILHHITLRGVWCLGISFLVKIQIINCNIEKDQLRSFIEKFPIKFYLRAYLSINAYCLDNLFHLRSLILLFLLHKLARNLMHWRIYLLRLFSYPEIYILP